MSIFVNEPKKTRDISYYRQRYKNRVFGALISFFASEAERVGLTKGDIATRLGKDPAQITRMLSNPSNMTLDSVSDLLLAMEAEAEPPAIVRFADRVEPNYAHPLVAKALGVNVPRVRIVPRVQIETSVTEDAGIKIFAATGG